MGSRSSGFILFFAVVCLLNGCVPARWRVPVLLVASLALIAAWDLGLLALLLGATVVNHLIARRLGAGASARLHLLRLGIVCQCGLLFAFKYLGFFVGSAEALLRRAGVANGSCSSSRSSSRLACRTSSLKAIALLVDTYRGQVQPDPNLAEHALYLLFFPSLTWLAESTGRNPSWRNCRPSPGRAGATRCRAARTCCSSVC